MPSPARIAHKVLSLHGTARSRELEAAGLGREQIARLVARGEVTRVARGLYALPGREADANEALLVVARRAPRAFFCLLTALRFHDLTTQAPFEVWIGVGGKDRMPRLEWPPLRVTRFSGAALEEGVESHAVERVAIRVTGVARTVADCFKFRNKIGLDVALEALRDARRHRRASIDELWRMSELCRVSQVMRPYLESIG